MKVRAWFELALAVVAAFVAIATCVYPTWFEKLFGASPDEGSGAFEWAFAIALIATSVFLSFLARRDFQRVVGPEA